MKIFIGYDERQPVAFHVLAHSIYKRASKPVSITQLNIHQLPIKKTGLTQFTYSRYLVPYLSNYEGVSLFLDADMLCLCDIHELNVTPESFNGCSAAVVTEGVEPFEYPSLILYNNAECKVLTPEYIENNSPNKLEWGNIAQLPKNYNHIVPYSGQNKEAKIVHYTQGIPLFDETKRCEYAEEWRAEYESMISTVTWKEIMGGSIHAQRMSRAGSWE